MNTFDTRCPVVRRKATQLVEHVIVGGSSRWEPFEREILWVRESRARCQGLHGGVVIAEFGEYHDFYGFLTSAEGAVGNARRQTEDYSVTATSSLSIVAEVEIFERPTLGIVDADPGGFEAKERQRLRERFGIARYRNVPDTWRLQMPSPYPDLPDFRPALDSMIVAPWLLVWSTADPGLDPGLVVEILRRRWAP